MRRECGEYQFLLIFYMLGFGGVFGGLLLWATTGFSCTRTQRENVGKDDSEGLDTNGVQEPDDVSGGPGNSCEGQTPSGDGNANVANADVNKLQGSGDLELDDQGADEQLELDLVDGIEDGEEGVIAQLVISYLMYQCAKRSEELDEKRKRQVAGVFILLAFTKKLGLKLILLIPLIIAKNIIPAAFFGIDFFVLMYFGYIKRYCPGSLYNELHVLRTGKKFVKV